MKIVILLFDNYTALDVIKYLRSYLDSITLAEVLAPVTVS